MLLKFLRVHTAVSDTYASIGNGAVDDVGKLTEITDFVVYEEYLSVARELEVDGFGNDIG